MGYKIKEFREKNNMSQSELARRSKVSRSIINQLENGKRTTTTTKTLLSIATALNATIDDIFFTESV